MICFEFWHQINKISLIVLRYNEKAPAPDDAACFSWHCCRTDLVDNGISHKAAIKDFFSAAKSGLTAAVANTNPDPFTPIGKVHRKEGKYWDKPISTPQINLPFLLSHPHTNQMWKDLSQTAREITIFLGARAKKRRLWLIVAIKSAGRISSEPDCYVSEWDWEWKDTRPTDPAADRTLTLFSQQRHNLSQQLRSAVVACCARRSLRSATLAARCRYLEQALDFQKWNAFCF